MSIDELDTAARHARLEIARKKKQDLDDLGNEQAGRETGRQTRFLGRDAKGGLDGSEKARAERRFVTLLEMLLATDADYARLHGSADAALRRAEAKADAALAALRETLGAAKRSLEEMMDRAPKLADGRAIFRRADGAVVDMDGRVVAGLSALDIVWPPSAVDYEAFLDARARIGEIEVALDNLGTFRTEVLGRWRDRLDDADDPPSKEMLEEIIEGVETWPEAARRALDEAMLSKAAAVPDADASVSARLDVPEL